MTSYRDNPDAIRALVCNDQVHRDLYTSQELFELEQEHFFANTWNYAGHESQLPKSGDWITNEIAGRPLIIVRHTDGSVRAMMNRCAHKGSRLVSAPCGNTGKFFRCPYHAWTFKTDGALLAIPLKTGYENTALHECESAKGLTTLKHVRRHRGFIFVKINDAGPDFDEYFGDSLGSIDNMADRSPEGELEIAGGCLRFMHQCNWKMFVENLNDTMHPMVVHESSAGTAKRMWIDKPAESPKPMAIEQFTPFMSDYKFFEDMGVRVFEFGLLRPEMPGQPDGGIAFLLDWQAPGELGLVICKAFERPLGQSFRRFPPIARSVQVGVKASAFGHDQQGS